MEDHATRQTLSILNAEARLGRWADGRLQVLPHGVNLCADFVSVEVKCIKCNARFNDVGGDDAGYLGYIHWTESHSN